MYQLRQPSAPLRRFVEHYWFVTHAPGEQLDLRVDVFVDGRADLIFNLGVPYRREEIGLTARDIAASNLDAQRLRPIRIHQRGEVHTCGVRFRLGGLGAVVDAPLVRFTDQTPPIAQVFGHTADALHDALAAADGVDTQAARIDAYLIGRLETGEPYERFARALERIESSGGQATVEEAADTAGVGVRQLDRLFGRYLGISPKRTAGIVRFQVALRRLMRDPGCTLGEVAASAGYFDQAHFIREFRRYSGGVPRGYRGYYPPEGPSDFAPNVVAFVQDGRRPRG